jgi:hypothetical protein
MKLLIDKITASDELKENLGFLDADIKYENIRPDLITATNEVIELIGKNVYDYIADKYPITLPIDDEDQDQNLVRACQYPIFARAYNLYAPSNDLSHTNDGRKMRNEEHEKMAFEWMINADNEAQEKRYYRALDDLIKLLDNSEIEDETEETIYTIWTSSNEYKATQSLFIRNIKQFSKYAVIDSPYLFIKLCPGIDECETDEIIPRIGITKFNELKTKLQENTPITDAKDLQLLDLIRRACANYAYAYGIERFSVSLLPDSVVQKYSSDRNTIKGSAPSLKMEPQAAIQAYRNTFEKTCIKIEELLKVVPLDLTTLPTIPTIADVCGGFSA